MLADTWAPFTASEGGDPGFMVEVARKTAEIAGYKTAYRMVPWPRAVAAVRRGDAELLLAVLPSQAKEEGLVLCPEPFAFDHEEFFTLRSSQWRFSGLASLEGQRLGVIQDYVYGDLMDRYIADHATDERRVSFSTGEVPIQTSLRKLAAGRVSVIEEDPSVVRWNAKLLGIDSDLRMAGEADRPVGIFMAVSPSLPNAARIASRFADGLRAIKRTSAFAELRRKYGIAD